jgi:hypothetical protein
VGTLAFEELLPHLKRTALPKFYSVSINFCGNKNLQVLCKEARIVKYKGKARQE